MSNDTLVSGIISGILIVLAIAVLIVVQTRQKKNQKNGTPENQAADPVVVQPPRGPTIPATPQPPRDPVIVATPPVGVQVGLPVMGPPVAAPIPQTQPDEAEDDEPVTSQEIVNQLKELPPSEAEAVKEKLIGAEVEWTLFYSSMMLKGSNQIEVTLLNADNAYPGVSFLVDLNQYPELSKIQWGNPVNVRGKISSIYSMYITLTDVSLYFPNPNSA